MTILGHYAPGATKAASPDFDTEQVKSRILAEYRDVMTASRLAYLAGEHPESLFWANYGAALLDLTDSPVALLTLAALERMNGND